MCYTQVTVKKERQTKTQFNTITEYEVLELAYYSLLRFWAHEVDIDEQTLKEYGHHNKFAVNKAAKYRKQLDEIHDKISIELEEK